MASIMCSACAACIEELWQAHHMPGMVPASAQPSAMRGAKNCQRVRISAQQAATTPQAVTAFMQPSLEMPACEQ